jgi:uncharacterized protein
VLDWVFANWVTLAVATPTLVVGYTIFGIAGFGAALIVAPILAHVIPVADIVPMLAALDMVAAFVGGFRLSNKIAKRELAWLAPLMVIGSIAGVRLLLTLPPQIMMLALGVFCVAYAIYSFVSPAARRHISQLWVLPFGLVGGVFSSMFATGGPIYAAYLSRRVDDKDAIRATVTTLIGLATVTRVILFTIAGVYSDLTLLTMAAALAPAMMLGTWLGHTITMRLSREHFFRMLYALMIASGSSLIIRAFLA